MRPAFPIAKHRPVTLTAELFRLGKWHGRPVVEHESLAIVPRVAIATVVVDPVAHLDVEVLSQRPLAIPVRFEQFMTGIAALLEPGNYRGGWIAGGFAPWGDRQFSLVELRRAGGGNHVRVRVQPEERTQYEEEYAKDVPAIAGQPLGRGVLF